MQKIAGASERDSDDRDQYELYLERQKADGVIILRHPVSGH